MKPAQLPAKIADACRQVIADSEVSELAEPLLNATELKLVCQAERRERRTAAPVGGTKLGGFPDLPPHVEWPKFDGRYLPFIAQINLADLPVLEDSPLPTTGRLYYFYWCTNEVHDRPAKVLWLTDDEADLRRCEASRNQVLVDWHGEWFYEEEMAIRFSVGVSISIPLAEQFAKRDLDEALHAEEIDFANEYEREVGYWRKQGLHVWERLRKVGDADAGISKDSYPLIELLGYPDPHGIFLYSLKPTRGGHTDGEDLWQNILHVFSYNNMLWSDAGSLGFFLRDHDLRRCDFSRPKVEVMSS